MPSPTAQAGLLLQMPRNRTVAAAVGGYRQALRIPDRRNAVQDILRRTGLAGFEVATQASLLTLMQRAPREAVVFDVGAHIGLYAAMIATVYRSHRPRIIAFEPTPATAGMCRLIREDNKIDFELVESAISAEPGEAELFLSDTWESSNSLNPDHRAHAKSVIVPVTTLDLFTAERNLDPYLIKIDVETYEPQVFAGAMATIERARPWIACELLADVDRAALAPRLERLEKVGYSFHRTCGTKPWPGVTAAQCLDMLDNTSRDWLLAPRPPGPRFYRDLARWTLGIVECDTSTNLHVPAGHKPPKGWNARYAPKPFLPVLRRRALKVIREPRVVLDRLRRPAAAH
jgi:FkbM family methyltransferase